MSDIGILRLGCLPDKPGYLVTIDGKDYLYNCYGVAGWAPPHTVREWDGHMTGARASWFVRRRVIKAVREYEHRLKRRDESAAYRVLIRQARDAQS